MTQHSNQALSSNKSNFKITRAEARFELKVLASQITVRTIQQKEPLPRHANMNYRELILLL